MKKIILLCLIFTTSLVYAQIPKPIPNTYVNDFAHALTPDQITTLNKNIYEIEKGSGVQFAIVLINDLPSNLDIEDYALLISRKWHIGTKNNGLVYVAALNQHKQRLEKASGLDSTFDEIASNNIMTAIKPSFRNKDYYGGLQILVSQVKTVLVPNQPQAAPQQVQATPVPAKPAGDDETFYSIVGFAFFVLVIYVIYRLVRRKRTPAYMTPPYGRGFNDGRVVYDRDPNYNGPMGGSGLGGFATGAIIGAAAGYAAGSVIDGLDNQNQPNQNGYDPNNQADPGSTPQQDDDSDNNSSNWGNWGGESGSDSSSDDSSSGDSGFSDSDSSNGTSSDW